MLDRHQRFFKELIKLYKKHKIIGYGKFFVGFENDWNFVITNIDTGKVTVDSWSRSDTYTVYSDGSFDVY